MDSGVLALVISFFDHQLDGPAYESVVASASAVLAIQQHVEWLHMLEFTPTLRRKIKSSMAKALCTVARGSHAHGQSQLIQPRT